MTPNERKARGLRAKELLDDPLIKVALREVRFSAHRVLDKASGDIEKVKRAADLIEAANTFQRFLILAMKSGIAAAKELDALNNQGAIGRGIGRMVRNREREDEDIPWTIGR